MPTLECKTHPAQSPVSPDPLQESAECATQGMERLTGLKPTMRQAMILIVAFAVILAADQELVRCFRGVGVVAAMFFTVLAGPAILGLLIITLDRYSPVKYWMGVMIAIFAGPLFLIYFDAVALANWVHDGLPPNPFVAVALNLFVVVCFSVCWRALRPRACLDCRRVALIPLMRLWGQNPRTANVRWCASCGGRYWKDREGKWRPDRRTTW